MPHRPHHRALICLPDVRDVRIQLQLVAVWIEDVEAVGDGVVTCADDGDVFCFEFFVGLLDVFWGVSDFESDVIEAGFGSVRSLWLAANFNQEHLVMRATGRVRGVSSATRDFVETERVAIKIGGTFEVGNVEDNVTEFFDLHMSVVSHMCASRAHGSPFVS